MNISVILKERRRDLGLTLKEIADQMDVSEATVQRWESGDIKSIKSDRVQKLAEILKVDPSLQLNGMLILKKPDPKGR